MAELPGEPRELRPSRGMTRQEARGFRQQARQRYGGDERDNAPGDEQGAPAGRRPATDCRGSRPASRRAARTRWSPSPPSAVARAARTRPPAWRRWAARHRARFRRETAAPPASPCRAPRRWPASSRRTPPRCRAAPAVARIDRRQCRPARLPPSFPRSPATRPARTPTASTSHSLITVGITTPSS